MKSIGSLSVIVTVFVAVLTITCPVPLRAADRAPDFRSELRTEQGNTVQECPLHTSTPSDCAATGTDRSKTTSIVMLRSDDGDSQAYQPGDPSGALLEDLVGKGSDREAEDFE
jgi:hypothetical protein